MISQGNVYGSSRDDNYSTTDLHAADSHEFVYSDEVVAWVRQRQEDSNRFTTEAGLNGAVARHLELLHDFETRRRKSSPVDYFGIDHS